MKSIKYTSEDSLKIYKNYRFNRGFFLTSMGLLTALSIGGMSMLNLVNSRPDITYIAVDEKGGTERVNYLRETIVAPSQSVMQFTQLALTDVLSFNFNNYDYVVDSQVPVYFSEKSNDGMKKFLLDTIGKEIVDTKSFVNLVIQDNILIEEKNLSGNPEWRVQLEGFLSFANGLVKKSSKVKFQLLVRYNATLKNPYGMIIDEIIINIV